MLALARRTDDDLAKLFAGVHVRFIDREHPRQGSHWRCGLLWSRLHAECIRRGWDPVFTPAVMVWLARLRTVGAEAGGSAYRRSCKPCLWCDSLLPAGTSACSWCGRDPGQLEGQCPECGGEGRIEVDLVSRAEAAARLLDSMPTGYEECPECGGSRVVEAPYAHLREEARA